jgi:hypothetical protein
MLAFLLDLGESRDILVEGYHFQVAGLALLALGAAKAIFGRKNNNVNRSYYSWLLLGSGISLVVLAGC